MIPDDWDVLPLGAFGKFKGGNGFPLRYQGHAFGDYPFFKVSDMNNEGNSLFMQNSNHWISEKSRKEFGATAYPSGSIVFAKIGAAIFLERKKLLVRDSCIDNNMMAFVFNSAATDRRYFHFIFLTINLGKLVSATALPSLNGRDIATLTFGFPKSPEQHAIAAALSDANALIASLDALIGKKRDLKHAAMQQLLAGKIRLPGFTGEWALKRLDTVCSMKSGEQITMANIDSHSAYPCYGGNGLRGYTTRFTHEGRYCLIGRQGALCGNVLGVDGKFFASEHAIVATPSEQIDVDWLTFILGKMKLNQYSESSAQPGLSVTKLLALQVAVPPTKAEQTAIAVILSDIDKDLAALEAKREKARALKQGMMQELLTGKIRLT